MITKTINKLNYQNKYYRKGLLTKIGARKSQTFRKVPVGLRRIITLKIDTGQVEWIF